MHDISAGEAPSGRILLAEDQPVNQRVATAMLESYGLFVDVVADGAEAVIAATSRFYQVILMDCQLPVMDGYEATREIRRRQGASGRTPIIAVTATATEFDQERCLTAGMNDYLTKPLSLKALGSVLGRWIPSDPDAAPGVVDAEVRTIPGCGRPHFRDAPPVLDAQIVGRLERLGRAAGEDLMGQLTILFLTDADVSVTALREALAGGDAPSIVRSAHALRGASSNLGATQLARLCAALAKDGDAGDLAGGETLLGAIEVELERVRSALGSRSTAP